MNSGKDKKRQVRIRNTNKYVQTGEKDERESVRNGKTQTRKGRRARECVRRGGWRGVRERRIQSSATATVTGFLIWRVNNGIECLFGFAKKNILGKSLREGKNREFGKYLGKNYLYIQFFFFSVSIFLKSPKKPWKNAENHWKTKILKYFHCQNCYAPFKPTVTRVTVEIKGAAWFFKRITGKMGFSEHLSKFPKINSLKKWRNYEKYWNLQIFVI